MKRQQVIVQNIRKRWRIPPRIGPDARHTSVGHRVVVGIGIHSPVQQNTLLHLFRIVLPVVAFYKIADKIAQKQVLVIKRKKAMGEMVHINGIYYAVFFLLLRPFWDCSFGRFTVGQFQNTNVTGAKKYGTPCAGYRSFHFSFITIYYGTAVLVSLACPMFGKSTLFNALTNAKALGCELPFCYQGTQCGDHYRSHEWSDKLAEIVEPQNTQPTTVEIVDIAGLIKGASKGEGLGNQFLANIREVDAIVHVVRCFDDDNVVHVDGSVNPVRDKEIIDLEFAPKDLETVEKRLDKTARAARMGSKDDIRALEVLTLVKAHLEKGKVVRELLSDMERPRPQPRATRPLAAHRQTCFVRL